MVARHNLTKKTDGGKLSLTRKYWRRVWLSRGQSTGCMEENTDLKMAIVSHFSIDNTSLLLTRMIYSKPILKGHFSKNELLLWGKRWAPQNPLVWHPQIYCRLKWDYNSSNPAAKLASRWVKLSTNVENNPMNGRFVNKANSTLWGGGWVDLHPPLYYLAIT